MQFSVEEGLKICDVKTITNIEKRVRLKELKYAKTEVTLDQGLKEIFGLVRLTKKQKLILGANFSDLKEVYTRSGTKRLKMRRIMFVTVIITYLVRKQ